MSKCPKKKQQQKISTRHCIELSPEEKRGVSFSGLLEHLFGWLWGLLKTTKGVNTLRYIIIARSPPRRTDRPTEPALSEKAVSSPFVNELASIWIAEFLLRARITLAGWVV